MKRIYFNLVFLVVAMLSVSSLVIADDRHYAPPAKLEDCKTALQCHYDNTFVKLISKVDEMGKPTKFLPGTYQFARASARSYRSMRNEFWIAYEYINQQGGTTVYSEVVYNTVQPDVKAPGSQWKEVSTNNWVCDSKNPNACGFTHTPWRADLKSQLRLSTQLPTDRVRGNKIESNTASLVKSPSSREPYEFGGVIIRNNSPYPVVVQDGDFNMADLSPRVITPIIVPAKTAQKIAKYTLWESSSALILTLKLGSYDPEGRNVDNTAVPQVMFGGPNVYNSGLVVNSQRFNVGAAYEVDMDWDIKRVVLNWVFSINPA